jgi:hypothetical protein
MANDKAFKVKNDLVVGGDTLTGNTELAAIAASKAVTAVDVFVYDTSKDSDGGAWRKRTQHTSWYNETLNTATRGARREFPAVAVIVAEAANVRIYDGDDPALPMWMVFTPGGSGSNFNFLITGSTRNGCTALNGKLCISNGSNALLEISFIDERVQQRYSSGMFFWSVGIVDRNSTPLRLGGSNASAALVSSTVNDVAMTVLPDAPIDPATGLPVPTIAVATDGGTSVIQDSGVVFDITRTGGHSAVSIHDTDKVVVTRKSGGTDVFVVQLPLSADTSDDNADILKIAPTGEIVSLSSTPISKTAYKALGANLGLSQFAPNYANKSTSMIAYTTSTYNTGWMNGDIKGAFLSDTDDTDLVGSGELVTNGDFATNDLTGWTDSSTGTGSVDASTGAAVMTTVDSSNRARLDQSVTTVAGQRYVIQATASSASASTAAIFVGTTQGGSNLVNQTSVGDGFYGITFTATTTTTWIRFFGVFDAGAVTFDNISVKLADADRSVNNKGLIVNGTVTRTAVATGADLVAYSGFSASNYLEQPYNSDLDFGTGDFCVMGWANFGAIAGAATAERVMFARGGTNQFFFAKRSGADGIYFSQAGRGAWSGQVAVSPNVWTHVALIRRGNLFTIAVNGVESASQSLAAIDLSLADGAARIGLRSDNASPFSTSGSGLALWRISATAPTAEQIKKIYEDEKFLFQDNAQATIYGASDAVTALAHDPVTDLLHVGTSAGRSVFSGLRRVSNTTTAVGTAISASNGLIAEE